MKQKSNQEEDIDEPMPAVDMKIIIPCTAYYHRVVALCIKNSRTFIVSYNLFVIIQHHLIAWKQYGSALCLTEPNPRTIASYCCSKQSESI